MIFERIKSEGIAHNSYFVASDGEAVVIDPRRDCQVYVDLARQHDLTVKYILETHRNEDYVIGSLELCALTGAEVFHGTGLDWKYGSSVRDGQKLRMGRLVFTAISTPGHTDESVSYSLVDSGGGGRAVVMVFTGDSIFVSDVGRTDLCGPADAARLASSLYDSIFRKLIPLGDGVIICPAHGAGSVCGLKIGDRDESTIGIERLQNPMLQYGKEAFVKHKVAEKSERPPYFNQMEKYNLEGAPPLPRIMPAPLSPSQFAAEMERGGVVIDTSLPAAFGGAHIQGSYSVWTEGLPSFAGWMLPYDKPLLLVMEDHSQIERAVSYLMRLGYDRISGYLRDGIEGWYDAGMPIVKLPLLSVQDLQQKLDANEGILVLDVRAKDEWDSGHIDGALHIYVGRIEERLNEIPRDKQIAVVCTVGHRAGIAASVLLRAGFGSVCNVLGGMKAWVSAGYPVAALG